MDTKSEIEAVSNPVAGSNSPGAQTFDVEEAGSQDQPRAPVDTGDTAYDQASLLIVDDNAPSVAAVKDALRLITVAHTLKSQGIDEHIPAHFRDETGVVWHPAYLSFVKVLGAAILAAWIPLVVPLDGLKRYGFLDGEAGLALHALVVVGVMSLQTLEYYTHCGVRADPFMIGVTIIIGALVSLVVFGLLGMAEVKGSTFCDYEGNEHGCAWMQFTYIWPATVIIWCGTIIQHPHHPASSTLICVQTIGFVAMLLMVQLANTLNTSFHHEEDEDFSRPFMALVSGLCFVLIKEIAAYIGFIYTSTPENRDSAGALVVGLRATLALFQSFLLPRMIGFTGFLFLSFFECCLRVRTGINATARFVEAADQVQKSAADKRAQAAQIIQQCVRAFIINKRYKCDGGALALNGHVRVIQNAWRQHLTKKTTGSSRLGSLGTMLSLKLVTWNSGNAKPFKDDLTSILLNKPPVEKNKTGKLRSEPEPDEQPPMDDPPDGQVEWPDILAFGQQESSMNMSADEGVEAWSPKARASNMLKDKLGGNAAQNDFWNDAIGECLQDKYEMVSLECLGEMRLSVWAKKNVASMISNVASATQATGLAGMVGNKGGIVTTVQVGATSMCFVSCHLAAHEGESKAIERNGDCQKILEGARVGNKKWLDAAQQFDHTFWMGDLNYRVDLNLTGPDTKYGPDDHVQHVDKIIELVGKRDFETLRNADQLTRELGEGRVLHGFKETKIEHVPTFKVERVDKLEYTKQRNPSFCDRILWKSLPGFAHEHRQKWIGPILSAKSSDHKPLVAMHSVLVHPKQASDTNNVSPTSTLGAPPPIGPTLVIQDLHAVSLVGLDRSGTSDPYVKFTSSGLLGDTEPETSVIEENCNPSWTADQIPLMECIVDMKAAVHHHVTISCWDNNYTTPDKLIGSVVVSMYDYAGDRPIPFNLPLIMNGTLRGRLAGTMHLQSTVGNDSESAKLLIQHKATKAILSQWTAGDSSIMSRKTFKFAKDIPLGMEFDTQPPADMLLLRNKLSATNASLSREYFNAADVLRKGTLTVDVCACAVHSLEHHISADFALIYLREVHAQKTGSKLHNRMSTRAGINKEAFARMLEAPAPEEEDPYCEPVVAATGRRRATAAAVTDEDPLMDADETTLDDLWEAEDEAGDVVGDWTVLAASTVRQGAAIDSQRIGEVKPGDVLKVSESLIVPGGKTRLSTNKGWISLRSSDGTPLVQRVGDASKGGTFYESIDFPEFSLILDEIAKLVPESSARRMLSGLREIRAASICFHGATEGNMDKETMTLGQLASYVMEIDQEYQGKDLKNIWKMLVPPRKKDMKRLTFGDFLRGVSRLRIAENRHGHLEDDSTRQLCQSFRARILGEGEQKADALGLINVSAVYEGGLADIAAPEELGAEGTGLVVLEVNGRCIVGLGVQHALDIVEVRSEERPLVLRLARLCPASVARRGNVLAAPPAGIGPRANTARRVWAMAHSDDMDDALEDLISCWLAMFTETAVPILAIFMETMLFFGVNGNGSNNAECNLGTKTGYVDCPVRTSVFGSEYGQDCSWKFCDEFALNVILARVFQLTCAIAMCVAVNLQNMAQVDAPFSLPTLCSYATHKQPWLWASQFACAAAFVYTFPMVQYGAKGVGDYHNTLIANVNHSAADLAGTALS